MRADVGGDVRIVLDDQQGCPFVFSIAVGRVHRGLRQYGSANPHVFEGFATVVQTGVSHGAVSIDDRYAEMERGSLPDGAFHGDPAFKAVDDLLDQGQSHSRADARGITLSLEERLEDLCSRLIVHPDTGVRHVEHEQVILSPDTDIHLAALGSELE